MLGALQVSTAPRAWMSDTWGTGELKHELTQPPTVLDWIDPHEMLGKHLQLNVIYLEEFLLLFGGGGKQ